MKEISKGRFLLDRVSPNVNVHSGLVNAPSRNSWHQNAVVTSACSGVIWLRLEHRVFFFYGVTATAYPYWRTTDGSEWSDKQSEKKSLSRVSSTFLFKAPVKFSAIKNIFLLNNSILNYWLLFDCLLFCLLFTSRSNILLILIRHHCRRRAPKSKLRPLAPTDLFCFTPARELIPDLLWNRSLGFFLASTEKQP